MEMRCFNPVSNWADVLATYDERAASDPSSFPKVPPASRASCAHLCFRLVGSGGKGNVTDVKE